MPFTDLSELAEEMESYTNHGRLDASQVDKVAGRWQYEREWLSRDRLIPKTRFELRDERRKARANRHPSSDTLELDGLELDRLGLEELRLLLKQVRERRGRHRATSFQGRAGAKPQAARHRDQVRDPLYPGQEVGVAGPRRQPSLPRASSHST